jgi:hypothetical protein
MRFCESEWLESYSLPHFNQIQTLEQLDGIKIKTASHIKPTLIFTKITILFVLVD